MSLKTLKWLSRVVILLLCFLLIAIIADIIKVAVEKEDSRPSLPNGMKGVENMTKDLIMLSLQLAPMICFSFFFENILIPVSKAFVIKDHSGSMGLKSSLISLSCSLTFYVFVLSSMIYIKL